MGDVGTGITNVPVHLSQHTNMLITVEEGVFVLAVHASAARAAVRGLVCLEAGIGKDDDQTLGVLIGRRNGRVLFSDELR